MQGGIYSKPIAFALMATVVILIGTLATMLLPMLSEEMHPKLEKLRAFTPLELAGRDIYQREGCVGCHTQTVRPLKTEVMRYGEYSKAGEFAYDRPFLWGSKRTGPDLARVGLKYGAAWHYQHFADPQSIAPKTNMPVYGWMKSNKLDAAEMASHMKALGLEHTQAQIDELKSKNELDALVAYMLWLGHAVMETPQAIAADALSAKNPLAISPAVIHLGEELFEANCAGCHGDHGQGGIGPSLFDNTWLGAPGPVADGFIKTVITEGTNPGAEIGGRKTEGGMPEYKSALSEENIWSIVAYIRNLEKQGAAPAAPAKK